MAQHRTLRAGRDPRSGKGSGWYVLAPRHRVRGKFACVRLVLLWIYAVENQLQAMCVPGRRRPALRGGLVVCVAYGGSDLAYLRTTAQSRLGVRMCEVASRTTMKSSTFLLSKSHSRSAIRPPAAEMRVGSRKKAGTRTLSTLRRVATCCTSVVTCFDVAAWCTTRAWHRKKAGIRMLSIPTHEQSHRIAIAGRHDMQTKARI
jgi:hypothetical protein